MTAVQQMNSLKIFLEKNLVECCRELVSFDDIGVLPDGKIRQAIAMLSYADFSYYRQSIVIKTIESLALRSVAEEANLPLPDSKE